MTTASALATLVACSGGNAPELSGLSDQVAQVGTEFKLDLNGTDPDGDRLAYSFKAADLTGVSDRAMITVSPSGAGVFRWTPIASDVGQHAFDFVASDGSNETTVTITIDVKSAIGSATSPIFRQPLGTGTTIELGKAQCVDLNVVVEDQDTAQVTIKQEEPLIDGAKLTQMDGQTATWHWCPSRAQEGDSRYTLVMSADDGENPKTIKNYLVVLRGSATNANCPGGAPAISHTASNQTTRLDLKPTATITDDKGLKDAPLFYYSFTNPGTSQVTLSTMTQLTANKVSGSNTNGTYAPTLPNPVASAPDGTTKTIYYVFVADDDDDAMGSCDHTTMSPVYTMVVTAGGSSTAGTCSACTADSQCGTGNECVYMGSMGDSYCLQGCGAGCPTGYTCSASQIWSVDGNQAYQCVPQSGSCQAPTGQCADDMWEENDSRSAASANPTLGTGLDAYVSCPSTTSTTRADDDWYKIVLSQSSRVNLEMTADGATDLDLHLYHSDGTVVSASTSYTSDENIVTCLPAATYYVKVNGYGSARSEYLLSYDTTAESCDTSCVDDSAEDDDTYSQARTTTYPTHTETTQKICKNDDDWYAVRLYDGESLTMDLTFTQATSSQDLDFHLYKDFTDLWPCSPSDPSTCTAAHGQGASSNEHAVYTVPTGTCASGCDYYVVVRGWNGASNSYGITLKVQ
ncbi:MAG TPA: pre-peptidase C-terminal domain-containing protein [Kofleriaceae bacterium]|nr:pre-peptidase C-terminal domain-containing protein [Kofleriaceae bacterium]